MITLSVITGVAPESWINAGDRAIATAFELIEQRNSQWSASSVAERDDGKVYGG